MFETRNVCSQSSTYYESNERGPRSVMGYPHKQLPQRFIGFMNPQLWSIRGHCSFVDVKIDASMIVRTIVSHCRLSTENRADSRLSDENRGRRTTSLSRMIEIEILAIDDILHRCAGNGSSAGS